jgi:hypothetical protein
MKFAPGRGPPCGRAVQRGRQRHGRGRHSGGVAGGAVAARGLYERARPALMHSRPGFVRGADAALATYDAVRGAIGR